MTEITLTWTEAAEAAREGTQRRLRRLARGRRDRYGWDPATDAWGNDIESTAAEMALAKARGVYWAPSAEPDPDGDVGDWFVRWTARDDRCLILYPKDRDAQPYALVTGCIPRFTIRGWIMGGEGKCPRFAAGKRLRVEGYLVPQCELIREVPSARAA